MFRGLNQSINARSVGLKMARRDLSRNKLQSFLVIAVIAMPVALGAFAFTYRESSKPTPQELVQYSLGEAQAKLVSTLPPSDKNFQTPLFQNVTYIDNGEVHYEEGDPNNTVSLVDPRTTLDGYTWLSESFTSQTIKTKTGKAMLNVLEVEAWNDSLKGRYFDFKGRAPRNENEALVNSAALLRLGTTIGGEVQLLDLRRTLTIVGTIEDTTARTVTAEVFVQPESITSQTGELSETKYYAIGTKPVTWDQIVEINKLGIGVISKAVILNPPPRDAVPYYAAGGYDSSTSFSSVLQLLVLLPVLLLPVIILTGSAFSFGARRQIRSIAVMSSLGAKKSTLRFITIANGLWLGLLGGVFGTLVGVVASYFVLPALSDGSKMSLPGFHVPWLLLGAIVLFGALIGVIVSIIPAFTASKVDVLSTLRGSRRDAKVKKRSGIIGLALIGIGVTALLICVPILVYLNDSKTYTELGWQAVQQYQGITVLVATIASFITIFGLMLGSSWLLVFARLVFRKLGTAANFATNDLVFNRKRFTAVIASVIATSFVAAIIISVFYTTTKPLADTYQPQGELYQLQVNTDYNENKLNTVEELNAYINNIGKKLGQDINSASEVASVSSAGTINVHRSFGNLGYKFYDTGELMLGAEGEIPYAKINFNYLCPHMSASPDSKKLNDAYMAGDWKLAKAIVAEPKYLDCQRMVATSPSQFVVAGPEDLRLLLGGRVDSKAEAALKEGKAVVFSKGFLTDGKLQLQWHPSGLDTFAIGNEFYDGELKYFPAQDVDGNLIDFTKSSRVENIDAVVSSSPNQLLNFIIPPKTAQRLGIDYYPMTAIVNYEQALTVSQKDALAESLPSGYSLEQGPAFNLDGIAWLLSAIAGLFVLASTAIALGLSQIESRADHSTLWSIGASKLFRSRVVSFQALTLTLLGTVSGATVGFLLIYVLSSTLQTEFQIPFPQTLFLVAGIPLLAALGFLVGTPKRYKFNPRLALD
ncbi:MAG: ABC transporter permease [Micrococcales bacterium]|nr:ABC transporter permease [Actinomycetota bacterium]NCA07960.1 ABC transporter permease [Micrococcales bacterium]